MTIHHRRTFGILGGRTAAAIAVLRELQQYHKANGVEYSLQLPFGGEAMRMALAAAYPGLGDVQKYYLKVMADPKFLELAGAHAQNVITGSARDDFWKVTIEPARASDGTFLHVRLMGVLPGRLGHSMAIMKELVDYLGAAGVGYAAIAPFGVEDPMRVGLAGRYPGGAELEAFSAKIQSDPRWLEIVARNAFNLVPGSMSDHMWVVH